MSDKRRFEFSLAFTLANKLQEALAFTCERSIICGSIRRLKQTVADIEIVYIPRLTTEPKPDSLFAEPIPVNLTDRAIDKLIVAGVLAKRLNVSGREAWGAKNKLAVLVKTGLPVDLFAATPENWFNYIVCRTGSADTNTRIATLAQQRGWRWNPYGSGFTAIDSNESFVVQSEQDVFRFVGLRYLEPCQR